jgi:RNA polymerase-binding transcription factor DksA
MTNAALAPTPENARRELEHRRAALLGLATRHRELEEEILSVREPDWEDTAADRTAATLLDRLADHERAAVMAIDAALARLEAGVWGVCVGCGRDIARGRLAAYPEAARCTSCEGER